MLDGHLLTSLAYIHVPYCDVVYPVAFTYRIEYDCPLNPVSTPIALFLLSFSSQVQSSQKP
jgi:hypothetical protein